MTRSIAKVLQEEGFIAEIQEAGEAKFGCFLK